ncbi:MAG TPA: hypothetical protein VGB59_10875 [Allosphingosinicella sp.]|jgi:hypothetical protein
MLKTLSIALALFACVPAAAPAQKLESLSTRPADIAGEINPADPAAEVQAVAASVAAHPLGSLANPVRVGGPEGARAYLGRLRCSDGSTPQVGAPRAGDVGPYGSVLQLYPLDCGSAAPGKAVLNLDLYQEEFAETRAAAGFTIAAR